MKKKEIQALTEKVNGKMTAIASTEAVDRVGDSLKVNDWNFKNFKKNPVLQAGHDYHPLSTIGIAKNICVENNQVIFEPQFHEITSLAREVKKMYEEKYLTAWSVGFIPAKEEGGKHELLEVSAVAVPANAEALTTLSQKSIENGTKDEEKEINNFIKKLKEKKETYKCECIDCGYKTTSEKHCKDIKCEKCGGEMRRQERPGTGKRIYKKEIKPYKNEHSCRLKDPKQYDSFKRGKRKSDGKEYSVIYGIKKGKLEDQAYRYNKDIWTENEARKHCKKHNGIKFEPIKKENKKEINNNKKTNENNEENKTNNKEFNISKKEGKVISRKNKTVIDKTIENLKNTVGALEKLLILSDSSKEPKKVDTPEKAIKNDNLKVVKNKSKMVQVQKLSEKQLAVRILQQINKQSSYGLNKIK